MATKKELKALELERTVSKAIECLKEASLSNIKDSDKIESLKKQVVEASYISSFAMGNSKTTISVLEKTIKDLKEEILKVNKELVKAQNVDMNSLEKENYEISIILKGEYSKILCFKSQYFEQLKQDVLNSVNIENIAYIICNGTVFKDVDVLVNTSSDILNTSYINYSALGELESFFIKHRDNQINWFIREKKERLEAVNKYRNKYLDFNPNDKRNQWILKSEYCINPDSEAHKEYLLAKKYIQKGYWEERGILRKSIIDYIENKDIEWIKLTLEEQRIKELDKIANEINAIGGEIVDVYDVRIGQKGELNFEADCKNAIVSVKTVGAGGYNIQRFHYRTLVKVKKHKQTIQERESEFKTKLTESEIKILENDLMPTIKELVLNGELSFKEGYVLNCISNRFYKDINEWYEWINNAIEDDYILNYMLRNVDFCKNRTELNKILTSLSKKKYIELDKGYKSTDIYLNIPKVSVIGGILGFTKKDHDEIYNIYQIQL